MVVVQKRRGGTVSERAVNASIELLSRGLVRSAVRFAVSLDHQFGDFRFIVDLERSDNRSRFFDKRNDHVASRDTSDFDGVLYVGLRRVALSERVGVVDRNKLTVSTPDLFLRLDQLGRLHGVAADRLRVDVAHPVHFIDGVAVSK